MTENQLNTKVSVVIPTFNREESVIVAINSVQSQTYQNIECIVVIDGQDEQTRKRLNQISSEQITIRMLEQNQGPATARNIGIRESTGEFVAFLDDDDRLHKTAIERLLDILIEESHRCAGVYPAQRVVDDSGNTSIKEVHDGRVENIEESYTSCSGNLFRREALINVEGFDESFPAYEDNDLRMKIFSKYYMLGLNEVLFDRHIHEDQLTNAAKRVCEGRNLFLEKYQDQLSNEFIANLHQEQASDWVLLGDLKTAIKHVWLAIRTYPVGLQHWYYAFWIMGGTRGYRLGRYFHKDIYDEVRN